MWGEVGSDRCRVWSFLGGDENVPTLIVIVAQFREYAKKL